ncbi:Holliday junction ATP-dependent DNA helicase RuvA [Deinococcus aluminii]|uniref:Holliday junction branch migration complex subunit RuvA n=1 Tax=Deinococcus aluminii TaxID=1656885 RepID=A0ABP9X917_9DEIO
MASRIRGVIAYLSGAVREVREASAVIVAGGVGYEVFCPASTLGRLVPGQPAELNIRHVVREDAQLLFGFSDADNLRLFDLLTGVSGVGPKLALSLLSALPVSALAQGLLTGDVKLLSSVSGVGKKTAERLVLELQNKVPEHLAAALPGGAGQAAPVASTAGRDAIEALLALGFREPQVRGVVAELLAADPGQSADALIRKGLGKLR